MVLPSSSRHWFSPLEKVGQNRVLMTIFGRVLCPLQPSCLPPPHCARALLLSSFLIVADPIFFSFPLRLLFHRQNTTLFVPLSLSSPSYHSFPLLSPTHPVTALVCLFSPNQLLPLIHLLPASPLFTASFVLSLFIASCVPPFLSYPFPAGSSGIQVYSAGCAQRAGSAGPWPVLALSLCS